MSTRAPAITVLLLLASSIGAGCTTVRASFPGHAPATVWTALVTAAEHPDYDDWVLSENRVWQDPDRARLEIYRVLERDVLRPNAAPWYQRRTWRFRVVLRAGEPPAAVFVSRGFASPFEARAEGRRYFDAVRMLLGGRASPVETREDRAEGRETTPADPAPGDDRAPIVDPDDLEPDAPPPGGAPSAS